jgi:hypothetical protein
LRKKIVVRNPPLYIDYEESGKWLNKQHTTHGKLEVPPPKRPPTELHVARPVATKVPRETKRGNPIDGQIQ